MAIDLPCWLDNAIQEWEEVRNTKFLILYLTIYFGCSVASVSSCKSMVDSTQLVAWCALFCLLLWRVGVFRVSFHPKLKASRQSRHFGLPQIHWMFEATCADILYVISPLLVLSYALSSPPPAPLRENRHCRSVQKSWAFPPVHIFMACMMIFITLSSITRAHHHPPPFSLSNMSSMGVWLQWDKSSIERLSTNNVVSRNTVHVGVCFSPILWCTEMCNVWRRVGLYIHSSYLQPNSFE